MEVNASALTVWSNTANVDAMLIFLEHHGIVLLNHRSLIPHGDPAESFNYFHTKITT
jgi:hypothetical protein